MYNRPLNEIFEELNFRLRKKLYYYDLKIYGYADLQERNGKNFPLVNQGEGSGKMISWNDNYNLQFYWRLLDSSILVDEENGKGGQPYRYNQYTVRLVGLGMQKKRKKSYEVNQDVCLDVATKLPYVTYNKERITIEDQLIDKLEVLNNEFSGNEFKHLKLENIAFAIDLSIKQKIICKRMGNLIQIFRGDSPEREFSISNDDFDLTTGEAIMTVKAKFTDSSPTFQLKSVDGEITLTTQGGILKFDKTKTDIEPGLYEYDIQWTDSVGNPYTIIQDTYETLPDVTR